jgi:hypothetical protein
MRFGKPLVLVFLFCVTVLDGAAALGPPPASCANRYAGTWVWTWMTGSTVIRTNGTATPSCAGCVRGQVWTCSGNTFTFYNVENPGQTWTMELSADGTQLKGSWGVAVRAGAAASKASRPDGNCSPVARVVSRAERSAGSDNAYEEVVANNDCTYRVKFEYSIANNTTGARPHWSNCVPASRTDFATGNRTSSTTMASLSVTGRHQRC